MRHAVMAGTLVWLACAAAAATQRGPFWVLEVLFLLAPLVLVPLAVGCIEKLVAPIGWPVLHSLAAVAAAASFLPARGAMSAALAALWLAWTLRMAARAVPRLRGWRHRGAAWLAVDVAYLQLPVGAAWLVLSRAGARPLRFEEPIVLLTAVHFHYAAFVAPVLVGLAGRVSEGRVYRAVVAGVLAGTPMLAAGITFSPQLERLGALVLAGALWTFAGWSLAIVVPRLPCWPPRLLLSLSAVALVPSMALALGYAWREAAPSALTTLANLARIHGTLNALGFGLLGLLGWSSLPALPTRRVPVHKDRRGR